MVYILIQQRVILVTLVYCSSSSSSSSSNSSSYSRNCWKGITKKKNKMNWDFLKSKKNLHEKKNYSWLKFKD